MESVVRIFCPVCAFASELGRSRCCKRKYYFQGHQAFCGVDVEELKLSYHSTGT